MPWRLKPPPQSMPRALKSPAAQMKELALDTLSPREIQFRVRAGQSPEEVAQDTGWPLDRVIRYAEPPLGERAYVAERAQSTYIHGTRGGSTLAEVVSQTTHTHDLSWDSYYSDGQWIVIAAHGDIRALWNFEPTGNTVHPRNDVARQWMGVSSPAFAEEPSQDTVIQDTVIIETATPRVEPVRLVAVPELEPETPPVSESTFQPVKVVDSRESSSHESDVIEESELPLGIEESSKAPTKKPKRGRAKVPSWDEILFGGPQNSP